MKRKRKDFDYPSDDDNSTCIVIGVILAITLLFVVTALVLALCWVYKVKRTSNKQPSSTSPAHNAGQQNSSESGIQAQELLNSATKTSSTPPEDSINEEQQSPITESMSGSSSKGEPMQEGVSEHQQNTSELKPPQGSADNSFQDKASRPRSGNTSSIRRLTLPRKAGNKEERKSLMLEEVGEDGHDEREDNKEKTGH